MRGEGGSPKHVLIIPDGAADTHRVDGLTPLAEARTPHLDRLARRGVSGLVQTLYEDLPRGSIVAQLGMLGWNPRDYPCHGRSAWEVLALDGVDIHPGDLVFRANLVHLEGRRLASYNAGYILSDRARPLVERIAAALAPQFPDFELHHNNDFRNSLVVRGAGLDPLLFDCTEPHESEGRLLEVAALVAGRTAASRALAGRINRYLERAAELLAGEAADALVPWSPCSALSLPSFRRSTGFAGAAAIVGSMDFLSGMARIGEIDFFRVGNGRPDTDYRAKGEKVTELLAAGYSFVVCHVNAPDEAAHMHDRASKVRSIEAVDRFVVGPVVDYFEGRPGELGGVMVAPDHYTNLWVEGARADAHSLHPVPFALWNGADRDGVDRFDEDAARAGRYGAPPLHHLDLLAVLGLPVGALAERRLEPAST